VMPASTKAGGQCMTPGPTDVCKTPSPAGPVPIPYPNIAMVNQADDCSSKVKVENKEVVTVKSQIPMSTGDEPGTAGGVVSSKFKGEVKFKNGSSKVLVEGNKWVYVTCMTGHNGSNANMPAGAQIAPSQTKVTVMP